MAAKGATISVRVNPEFKWAMELLSRSHRRNLSSTLEWAIQIADPEIFSLAQQTYSPDDETRTSRLSLHAPSLLTYDEKESL